MNLLNSTQRACIHSYTLRVLTLVSPWSTFICMYPFVHFIRVLTLVDPTRIVEGEARREISDDRRQRRGEIVLLERVVFDVKEKRAAVRVDRSTRRLALAFARGRQSVFMSVGRLYY